MKKILLLFIVAGSSVSFNVPVKKVTHQEVEKVNLNMLMIKYKTD